jgi:hypothetical protein
MATHRSNEMTDYILLIILAYFAKHNIFNAYVKGLANASPFTGRFEWLGAQAGGNTKLPTFAAAEVNRLYQEKR